MIFEVASGLSSEDLLSYSSTNKYIRNFIEQPTISENLWQPHLESYFPGSEKPHGMTFKEFFLEQLLLTKDRILHDLWNTLESLPDILRANRQIIDTAIIAALESKQQRNDIQYTSWMMHCLFNLESIHYAFSQKNTPLRHKLKDFTGGELALFLSHFDEIQIKVVLKALGNEFLDSVSSREGFPDLMEYNGYLSKEHRVLRASAIFDSLKNQIKTIFNKPDCDGLGRFLSHLSNEQILFTLEQLKETLPVVMKFNGYNTAGRLFLHLNSDQKKFVFNILKPDVSDYLNDSYALGHFIHLLDDEDKSETLRVLIEGNKLVEALGGGLLLYEFDIKPLE